LYFSAFKVKQFIIFLLRWIGNNLSIPFWVVGHIHLSLNVYEDIHEILSSFGMNILVGIGFWLEWRVYKKEENEEERSFRVEK